MSKKKNAKADSSTGEKVKKVDPEGKEFIKDCDCAQCRIRAAKVKQFQNNIDFGNATRVDAKLKKMASKIAERDVHDVGEALRILNTWKMMEKSLSTSTF